MQQPLFIRSSPLIKLHFQFRFAVGVQYKRTVYSLHGYLCSDDNSAALNSESTVLFTIIPINTAKYGFADYIILCFQQLFNFFCLQTISPHKTYFNKLYTQTKHCNYTIYSFKTQVH